MATNMKLPFPIIPASTDGVSHYARYGVGGYYSVETDEERLGIPQERLEDGLMVYVISTGRTWRYLDKKWTEVIILDPGEYRDITDWVEKD